METVNSEHPIFLHSGDETFPVIRPLSELPNRVTLEEISPSLKPNRALASPDTAVLAEIEVFLLADKRSSSIACVLANSPILLCVRNGAFIESDAFVVYCKMLFPKSRIAIKSGLVRNMKLGKGCVRPVIYVACPAAIEFLGLPTRDLSGKKFGDMAFWGHSTFLKKRLVTSSLWYKAALEAVVTESDDTGVIAQSHVDLACCMAELQRFEEAILSGNEALRLAPEHPEGLYFRAMGLRGVQSHWAAMEDLLRAQNLLLASGDEKLEKAMLDDLVGFGKLAAQQVSGVYDVQEFFVGECDPKEALEWADFTSEAIEIRLTGDGRGRGVFLTREVELGDLLMVSNPLVAADSLEELQVLSIRACSSVPYSRVRRILKMLQDPRSTKQLPLPGIQDFSFDPSGSTYRWVEDDGGAIDVHSIKRVVEQASRRSFKVLKAGRLTSKQLFALPNFINHSCLPNSSMLVVGGALFVRAATRIQAGEEITVSYIDCLHPQATRAKMLSKAAWDFTCRCERCEVESRYKAQLQGVPGHQMSSLEAFVKRVDKLESALGKMKSISEEERGMIQVGHILAYLQVAGNKAESKTCREIGEKYKPLLSEIEAMKLLRRYVPGHGRAIALIARIVREYVLRLEWHPSFEVEFDAAMVSMIGDISLPSEDYITLCDHLESDENVADLFG